MASLKESSEATSLALSLKLTMPAWPSARHWKVSKDNTSYSLAHIVVDFKTQLSASDYGNFLANEPSPLSTATIADKATQILVDQFNFLRSNAGEPLGKFLDYITCVVIIYLFLCS